MNETTNSRGRGLRCFLSLTCALCLLAVAQPASAAVFEVTTGEDTGLEGSLRWAVSQANFAPDPPHTILLGNRVHTLDNELNLFGDMTLQGVDANQTIIQASDIADDPNVTYRLINHSGSNTLVLRDLTLARGRLVTGSIPSGGAVRSPRLDAERVIFKDNIVIVLK